MCKIPDFFRRGATTLPTVLFLILVNQHYVSDGHVTAVSRSVVGSVDAAALHRVKEVPHCCKMSVPFQWPVVNALIMGLRLQCPGQSEIR